MFDVSRGPMKLPPALVRSVFVAGAALVLAAPGHAEMANGPVSLDVTISGLKSDKGVVRLALCPPNAGFPDCKTAALRTGSVKIAGGQAMVVLTGIPAGTYALSVFHDANGNGKLDTFAGIPREGYGFSRNPGFKPRAPTFAETQISVNGTTETQIRMRYIL